MEENPIFNIAADFVNNTSKHIFLTGKAGTGKTTFLKHIRETTRKKCVVVAPTGVAAINAGGVTMHSFFQLPLGPFIPVTHKLSGEGVTDQYTLFKNIRVNDNKRELFRDLELLIIDEVSMVRCDMLDATDAILRYFRRAPHTPFGGVQVLYIGDLFQLPPVMPDSAWSLLRQYYESPFFFHSRVASEAPPVYIELEKIYRQSQQTFIDVLNRIRNNEATADDLSLLNSRRGPDNSADRHYVTLTTHNYKADRINAEELQKLPGPSFEFKGIVEGDFPEKALPTEPVLELKEGAQVMFIRNDKSEERRYYNGKIATVSRVDSDGVAVVFPDSPEEFVLEQETWTNIRYTYNRDSESIDEEKLGAFTQYPLRLAWAITIHKSQGLTFENAIIDAGDSFAPGQVYVALSRCTSLDGLVCHSKILPSSISTDPLVIEFSRRASGASQLKVLLEEERRVYQHQVLMSRFDFQKLVDSTSDYVRFLQGRSLPDLRAAIDCARQMLRKIEELHTVALKFQDQLRQLHNDEVRLGDRIAKATEYFDGALKEHMLAPIDEHIKSLKGVKKIKKYLQYLRRYRNEIARKIDLFSFGERQEEVTQPLPKTDHIRKPKGEAGDTLKETLSLLKSGLTMADIAARRGLVLSTIEGHIAQLIRSGEVDILDVMAEDRMKTIRDVITDLQTDRAQPVKTVLGDEYSYGEIRAVISHMKIGEGISG